MDKLYDIVIYIYMVDGIKRKIRRRIILISFFFYLISPSSFLFVLTTVPGTHQFGAFTKRHDKGNQNSSKTIEDQLSLITDQLAQLDSVFLEVEIFLHHSGDIAEIHSFPRDSDGRYNG